MHQECIYNDLDLQLPCIQTTIKQLISYKPTVGEEEGPGAEDKGLPRENRSLVPQPARVYGSKATTCANEGNRCKLRICPT